MSVLGRRCGVLPAMVAASAIAACMLAPGSQASFNATDANPAEKWAFTALYAPSNLTATTSGHDVSLSWSAGTNGNGYSLLGVNNGTSSDCTGASFSAFASPAGTSYTDTGRYTPQGTWYCYQSKTSYSSWTSVNSNPTASTQLGFVVTDISAANGGTAGKIDTGDVITIDFNQAVDTSTAPGGSDTICQTNSNPYTIVVGSATGAGACNANEATDLGTLTGGTSATNGRWNVTWAWSNGNKTLTATLGNHSAGNGSNLTGTWTLNPTTTATNLKSSTGAFHVCDTNTGGGNCLPTLGGSF
jgi:hypothetical protein